MTQDDVLFGYRLQLFDLAGRTSVANACRVFGVHRSTYYRWKAAVERSGLELLRPRERRRPAMPNQLPRIVEERIVAFRAWAPRARAEARRGAARAAGMGWACRVAERRLEGALPPRAQHARQAARARRGLQGALRAAGRHSARASRRDDQAGRAGWDRLLLRRPPARHRRRRLATDRDRHLLVFCLGRARALQVGRAEPAPDIALRAQ